MVILETYHVAIGLRIHFAILQRKCTDYGVLSGNQFVCFPSAGGKRERYYSQSSDSNHVL
jgi:hypothetical protein